MNKEIEEIEKEVNSNYVCMGPLKPKEQARILLSHIHTLEQEIQDIRNDPDHWDRKYEKFLLDKISTFEKRVKEWDYISHLNATMKQLDTNYLSAIQLAETYKKGWEQAETERERLSRELIEERMKVVELESERDGFRNGQMQVQDMLNGVMDSNKKIGTRLKKLQEAVDEYKQFISDNWTDKGPARSWREFAEAHEELFKTRDEV